MALLYFHGLTVDESKRDDEQRSVAQPRDLEEEAEAEAPLLGNAAENGNEGTGTMDDASEPMLIPPVDQGRLMAEMRASSEGHETPA